MIKQIAKYLGIGLLLGIGISTVDYIHWEYRKDDIRNFTAEIGGDIMKLRDLFYVEGMESVLENPKEYDPNVDLTLSLQGYKKFEDKIRISGKISNTGTSIWSGLFLRVQAFTEGENIISECSISPKDIKPGHWEAFISECYILEEFQGKEIKELSFRIKKAFHDKKVIKSYNHEVRSTQNKAATD